MLPGSRFLTKSYKLPTFFIWPTQAWPSKRDHVIWRKALLKTIVTGPKFRTLKIHWKSGSLTQMHITESGTQLFP